MRDGDFRIRGKEISRVEGLSDAVFGFAITLLIVSLEVPKTAEDTLHMMRGFFSFAITFTLLFLVWRTQFKFFRRYGLEDNKTVWLNGGLLFTILFFVYPLKFVFGVFVDTIGHKFGGPAPAASIAKGSGLLLFTVYGLGWAAVFLVFALLYSHALSKREELALDAVEEFDTRDSIAGATFASLMGVAMAAMAGAMYLLPAYEDQVSYAFLAIIAAILSFIIRRKRTRRTRRREMVAAR